MTIAPGASTGRDRLDLGRDRVPADRGEPRGQAAPADPRVRDARRANGSSSRPTPATSPRAPRCSGIGATFEGVLRHHTIMPDGSNRDSAFYGVIAPEWPDGQGPARAARPMTGAVSTGPITTDDYHTGGEPFRIVTGGVPVPEGADVPARRRWAAEHLDDVRRLLVNEPRGHADMYGCFVTPPDDDGADLGVVFFHNEGYSTACGHGTIALVTWAIDTGRVAVPPAPARSPSPWTCPSGRLRCVARLDDDGRVDAVRFRNVPSFVLARDVTVDDAAGRWPSTSGSVARSTASLDVRTLGLDVSPAALPALIALQRRAATGARGGRRRWSTRHEPDLHGIYGVIFWEPLASSPAGTIGAAQRDGLRRRRGRPVAVRLGDLGPAGRSCTPGASSASADRLHHRSIVDSRVRGRDRRVTTEVAERDGGHDLGRGQRLPDRAAPIRARSARRAGRRDSCCADDRSTAMLQRGRHLPSEDHAMIGFIVRTIVVAIAVAVVAYFYPDDLVRGRPGDADRRGGHRWACSTPSSSRSSRS